MERGRDGEGEGEGEGETARGFFLSFGSYTLPSLTFFGCSSCCCSCVSVVASEADIDSLCCGDRHGNDTNDGDRNSDFAGDTKLFSDSGGSTSSNLYSDETSRGIRCANGSSILSC
jgi:hypothetical protein